MLGMSEAQAFVALPTFLEDQAETQYCANVNGESLYRVFTCWPEAVQRLLHTYATSAIMCDALIHLRSVTQ